MTEPAGASRPRERHIQRISETPSDAEGGNNLRALYGDFPFRHVDGVGVSNQTASFEAMARKGRLCPFGPGEARSTGCKGQKQRKAPGRDAQSQGQTRAGAYPASVRACERCERARKEPVGRSPPRPPIFPQSTFRTSAQGVILYRLISIPPRPPRIPPPARSAAHYHTSLLPSPPCRCRCRCLCRSDPQQV